MEGVFVEKWAVFTFKDGRWQAKLDDRPPKNATDAYRVRIPVPEELARPAIDAKLVGIRGEKESATSP